MTHQDQLLFFPWRIATGVTLVASISIAAFTSQFQFGGYDLSPLVDLSYRLASGEVPGKEFINTLPASFLLWLKGTDWLLARSTGYQGWFSLILSGCLIYLLTCAVTLRHARRLRIPMQEQFIIIAMLSMPLLATGHLWHSTFSSYAGLMFAACAMSLSDRAKEISWFDMAEFSVLAGFAFYSKQNVGPPLVLAVAIFFAYQAMISRDLRRLLQWVAPIVIGVAAFGAIISFALEMTPQAIGYYLTSVAGRGLPSSEMLEAVWGEWPNQLAVVIMLIPVVTQLLPFRRDLTNPSNPKFMIAALAMGVGFLAAVTNWDIKFNDVPLFATALLMAPAQAPRPLPILRPTLLWLIVGGLFVCCILAFQRYRMETVGYGVFFEEKDLRPIRRGYFSGLRVGPRMHRVRNEIADALDRVNGDKVFCGPRIEFCYADFELKSPRMLPLWWHPGTSFARQDVGQVAVTFLQSDFDSLIFLRGDRTRMPDEIADVVNRHYVVEQGYKEIDVYRRKHWHRNRDRPAAN